MAGSINLGQFYQFLMSGSINPEIDNVNLTGYGSKIKISKFVKTEFKRNDYTLMDLPQLKTLPGTAVYQDEQTVHTFMIDDQVSFKVPNVKSYFEKSKRLSSQCNMGCLITATLGLVSLLLVSVRGIGSRVLTPGFWPSRLVTRIPFKSASALTLLSAGLFFVFAWRGDTARSFCSNVKDINFKDYAEEVGKIRKKIFTPLDSSSQDCLPSFKRQTMDLELPIEKVFSPSEIEILQLQTINARAEKVKNFEDLLEDFSFEAQHVTPEWQAIKAYFDEVVSIEWIKQVVREFKEAITPLKLANNALCSKDLDAIDLSMKKLLKEVGVELEAEMIKELRTYLDARIQRKKDQALPKGDDLKKYSAPIKTHIQKQILEIVKRYKIPVDEISVEATFWKTAEVKPTAWIELLLSKTKK